MRQEKVLKLAERGGTVQEERQNAGAKKMKESCK